MSTFVREALPVGYGFKRGQLIVNYLDSTKTELRANHETDSQAMIFYFAMLLKENSAKNIKIIRPYGKDRSMDIIYWFDIPEKNLEELKSRIEPSKKLVKDAMLFVSGDYASPEEVLKSGSESRYKKLVNLLFKKK